MSTGHEEFLRRSRIAHDDRQRRTREWEAARSRDEREDWLRRNGHTQAGGLRDFLVVVLLIVGGLLIARYQGYTPSELWAAVQHWVDNP